MPRGIDVSHPDFRTRLAALCRARGHDATSLSDATGLSRKVVDGLLRGTRRTASEDALRRIAAEVGVTYELLVPLRRGRSRRRSVVLALVAVGSLVVVALLGAPRGPMELVGACNGAGVEVRDARSGLVRWHHAVPSPLTVCARGKWGRRDAVLYGTAVHELTGGNLIVRALPDGDSLWATTPDASRMHLWYPPGIAETGRFQPGPSCVLWPACDNLCLVDIDGDSRRDLVVLWQWVPWYPTLVTMYPAFGGRGRAGGPRTYLTCGRVMSAQAFDIDDDAATEIVCAGTNNAAAYQGAMLFVLDGEHWSGGSVDTLSSLTHWAPHHGLEDGSLARVVFPQFDAEFMEAFGVLRLDAWDVRIGRDVDGELWIEMGIGNASLAYVTLLLDSRLNPVDFTVDEEARTMLDAASPGLGPRFDDVYIRTWLERRRRFGVADVARPGN